MTNNDELELKLKAAVEKVTALNLDTAQIERGNDGYYECPVCCGEGGVEAKTDFCNIDGVALGVQFYGIGEHHGAAEEYFRTVAPANILALLAERDADKKRIAELDSTLEREKSRRIAEQEALVAVPLIPTLDQLAAGKKQVSPGTGRMSRLMSQRLANIYRAMILAATGIKLDVGE